MMVGVPEPKGRGPRVFTRTPARTRTRQLPSHRGNYQDHSRQNTWSRITNEKKVCQETMVYKQRSFKQTPNSIKERRVTAKEVSQGDSNEKAIELRIDTGTSLARGRYNQYVDVTHNRGEQRELLCMKGRTGTGKAEYRYWTQKYQRRYLSKGVQ